ncbi:MAG: hypothetical protein WCI73_13550, partial [Phycisphaerae bacterium]
MSTPEFTPRQIVLEAMKKRPADPWPRGRGHVVLGIPGSPQGQKAYHEPGGSFSPAPGSFGVSIWFQRFDDPTMLTSDQVALGEVHQQYLWPTADAVPAIQTQTPTYT